MDTNELSNDERAKAWDDEQDDSFPEYAAETCFTIIAPDESTATSALEIATDTLRNVAARDDFPADVTILEQQVSQVVRLSKLSDEAMAVLAGFAHLPTHEHQCIFADPATWREIELAFPRGLFDARRAQDPDFFDSDG